MGLQKRKPDLPVRGLPFRPRLARRTNHSPSTYEYARLAHLSKNQIYIRSHPAAIDRADALDSPAGLRDLADVTDSAAPASREIALLRAAYAAFNARDVDAALALMAPDVEWPRAFKGGFVQGREAIRAYWTEQWSEIDPQVEPVGFFADESGGIVVEVHQVVRDLAGGVLADVRVGHRFVFEGRLIRRMEVCAVPVVES